MVFAATRILITELMYKCEKKVCCICAKSCQECNLYVKVIKINVAQFFYNLDDATAIKIISNQGPFAIFPVIY